MNSVRQYETVQVRDDMGRRVTLNREDFELAMLMISEIREMRNSTREMHKIREIARLFQDYGYSQIEAFRLVILAKNHPLKPGE